MKEQELKFGGFEFKNTRKPVRDDNNTGSDIVRTSVRIREDGLVFIVQFFLLKELIPGFTEIRKIFGHIYQFNSIGIKPSSLKAIINGYNQALSSGFIKPELIE